MGKTNDLRKMIRDILKTVCEHVYHENADNKKMYPHIVYSITSVDLGDMNRCDSIIDIDVWTKSGSYTEIEDICDSVEALLNCENIPQERILPTFYLSGKKSVRDEDKSIQHRIITVQAQTYQKGDGN